METNKTFPEWPLVITSFFFFFFFADDLILFAEATEEQMEVVMECLERFSHLSGQKISRQKSSIFFSQGVEEQKKEVISTISGKPTTKNMGTYLGTSSIHGRITVGSYQLIDDRIGSRLEGWKTKHIALAGRNTLAQSILTSIPLYHMQAALVPKGL